MIDERVAVALDLEDDVVAVVLFICGWIQIVPCFQICQLTKQPVGGRRATTKGRWEIVNNLECETVASIISVVASCHVEDHSSD